jgi:hypothetical protein
MKGSVKIIILLLAHSLVSTGVFSQGKPSPEAAGASSAYRMGSQWGIGVKATTGGIGLEVVKGLTSRMNIRVGYSAMNIPVSLNITLEGISAQAKADLKFQGANLTMDYYLVRDYVHVSAGIIQNGMHHTITVVPLSSQYFGDILIPASELGTVKGEITPGILFSPYLGLGIGNTLSENHRLSFNFEIGTLYHGSPKLELSGTSVLSPMASGNNQAIIMAAIAPYKWYPLISFQLTYRIL